MNIYSIFGFNTQYSKGVIDQFTIAVVFAVFLAAITSLVYLTKRNRAVIVVFATYAIITVCTYFVGFSALSVLPVVGMLLLSFIITKDKRFIRSLIVSSVLLMV